MKTYIPTNQAFGERRAGVVAISIVLVLGALLVAIATTITYLSIGESQSSLALYKGTDNLTFVEGCAEDYLLRIRSNSSFTAQPITQPGGTCTITINSPYPNWDITVSSSTTDYKRTIRIVFTQSSGGLTLTSWREI